MGVFIIIIKPRRASKAAPHEQGTRKERTSEELRGGAGGETHGPNNQTTSDVREREGYQHDGNTLAAGRPNRVPTKPRMRDDEANDRIHLPEEERGTSESLKYPLLGKGRVR